MQDRVRNDDNNDSIGETIPHPEFSAYWDIFSNLSEEEIVKIFKNNFKLLNLRYFHGFEDTWEEDSKVVKNNSFKSSKITGTYKDFGKSINKV